MTAETYPQINKFVSNPVYNQQAQAARTSQALSAFNRDYISQQQKPDTSQIIAGQTITQELSDLYEYGSSSEDIAHFFTLYNMNGELFKSIAYELKKYFPQATLNLIVDISEPDPSWYTASIKVGIPPGQNYMELYALMNRFYDEWWYKIDIESLIHISLL